MAVLIANRLLFVISLLPVLKHHIGQPQENDDHLHHSDDNGKNCDDPAERPHKGIFTGHPPKRRQPLKPENENTGKTQIVLDHFQRCISIVMYCIANAST